MLQRLGGVARRSLPGLRCQELRTKFNARVKPWFRVARERRNQARKPWDQKFLRFQVRLGSGERWEKAQDTLGQRVNREELLRREFRREPSKERCEVRRSFQFGEIGTMTVGSVGGTPARLQRTMKQVVRERWEARRFIIELRACNDSFSSRVTRNRGRYYPPVDGYPGDGIIRNSTGYKQKRKETWRRRRKRRRGEWLRLGAKESPKDSQQRAENGTRRRERGKWHD